MSFRLKRAAWTNGRITKLKLWVKQQRHSALVKPMIGGKADATYMCFETEVRCVSLSLCIPSVLINDIPGSNN
ncbi:MAG: hypothetical protein ACKESB_01195 [Candidatus Hodgkinia cicadicola]